MTRPARHEGVHLRTHSRAGVRLGNTSSVGWRRRSSGARVRARLCLPGPDLATLGRRDGRFASPAGSVPRASAQPPRPRALGRCGLLDSQHAGRAPAMTWTKLGDDFPDRPPIAGLSDGAFRLHVSALIYSNRLLTDGLVTESQVRRLLPRFRRAYLDELLAAGVWAVDDGGYRIVDSLADQPSRAVIEARREMERTKKAMARGKLRGDPPAQLAILQERYRAAQATAAGLDVTNAVSPGDNPGESLRDSRHPRLVPARPDPEGIPVSASGSGHHGDPGNDPAGWASFGPEWDAFLAQWRTRFGLPPTARQRRLLWPIVDAWPQAIAEWVARAPSGTSLDVVDHVLRQHKVAVGEGLALQHPDQPGPREGRSVLQSLGEVLKEAPERAPSSEAGRDRQGEGEVR